MDKYRASSGCIRQIKIYLGFVVAKRYLTISLWLNYVEID